jgi:hypothetical protein
MATTAMVQASVAKFTEVTLRTWDEIAAAKTWDEVAVQTWDEVLTDGVPQ